jgi:hypothetical protein
LADVINGFDVFRETEPVVVFEIGVVIDGLFEVLWVIIDKDGVLLDFVSVDFEELDFRVFFDDFVEIFGVGLV